MTGTGLTDGYCYNLHKTCTVNGDGTACAVVDCSGATGTLDYDIC